MFGYLALSLLLLVVAAWFILQPFLAPAGVTVAARTASRPPVVLPPATPAAPAVAAAAAPVAAVATAPSTDDLRARVEAAIAARKAAMMRHSCDGCGTPVDAGDAFCRSCGTRVEEG